MQIPPTPPNPQAALQALLRKGPEPFERFFNQLEVIRKATQDLYAYLDRKSKELQEVELLLRAGENINH